MKCEICDEEFDTANQLMQHKAQMHAGESAGVMPKADEETQGSDTDDLEKPDYQEAADR
jgi:hypothetical protein